MFNEIVTYLYWFDDRNFHSLNDFLHEKYGDVDLADIRAALVNLISAKRIEIEHDTHKKLNNHSRINQTDDQNTFRDLTNLPINARLTDEEREKMQPNMREQEQELIELANNFVIYCVKNNLQNEEIDYYPTATLAAIPKEKQSNTLNTLYNRLHLVNGGGIAKKVKIKFKPKLTEYFEQLETEHFKKTGLPLIAKSVDMDIKDACEFVFQKHKAAGGHLRRTKETYKPIVPNNVVQAEKRMKFERVIIDTDVHETMINPKCEEAATYQVAIKILDEKNKPKETVGTYIEKLENSGQFFKDTTLSGSQVSQQINEPAKETNKKQWWLQGLEWLWKQIKKPIGAALTATIVTALTTLKISQSCNQSASPSQSQSTHQQTTGDTSRKIETVDSLRH